MRHYDNDFWKMIAMAAVMSGQTDAKQIALLADVLVAEFATRFKEDE